MGKPKKYAIKTINFGENGHPARILVEQYIKLHGKNALSQLIRRLVVIYLMDKPEYKDWKAQLLIHERKEIGKNVASKMQRRCQIDEELREMGIDPDDIF
ncbi:hypothetical protein K9M74_02610 [Candidatus Woesearchaeota archaeon]|nr:hypothetical protein [Bacteroidales bacterium]MCF7798771.1 hypothetical protein [Candidatus Woesearchaeota archaeon]